MNRNRQTRKVLAILRMLCMARIPLSIKEIIRKLLDDYGFDSDDRGLNSRTIDRDINFLRREMGYDIKNIRGEGYVLEARNMVLPLTFTKEQLQALCFGQELFAPFEGTHFGDAIEGAYKTIANIYQKNEHSTNNLLINLENAILLHAGPTRPYSVQRDKIKTIFDAILEEKEIELRYTFTDNPEGVPLTVQPHKLIIYKDSLYLLAFPQYSKDREFRTFLMDRIKSVVPTDKKFTAKDTSSFEYKLQDSFGILVYGPKKTVKILFDKDANYIMERVWHPSQRIKKMKNGIQLEMDILVNKEVATWLQGFGTAVKKVEPKELREMV